jgi:Na+-transporting NADH:ubiquinone oxidoreductase subunit B
VWFANGNAVDGVTTATPLYLLKAGRMADIDIFTIFTGNYPGSIGETSSFLIILSGLLLVLTRVASWRIIISALLSLSLFSALFSIIEFGHFNKTFLICNLFAGGVLFATFFMLTDPVTAPRTQFGKLIYGVLFGFLVIMFRIYNSAYQEVTMFVVLILNVLSPMIDSFVVFLHSKNRRII